MKTFLATMVVACLVMCGTATATDFVNVQQVRSCHVQQVQQFQQVQQIQRVYVPQVQQVQVQRVYTPVVQQVQVQRVQHRQPAFVQQRVVVQQGRQFAPAARVQVRSGFLGRSRVSVRVR